MDNQENEQVLAPETETSAPEAAKAAAETAAPEAAPEAVTASPEPAAREGASSSSPAAQNGEAREQRDAGKQMMRNRRRKKVCIFCADKIAHIDYKDIPRIRKNLSERAKILPRRVTGTCAMHQRQLTLAVKRARTVALIPYITD